MSADVRERILEAAAQLLVEAGSEGMSTRAVATAAGVQAPTLYRLFGDKQGLIEAVVAYGFERYFADKRAQTPTGDPVGDLRRGWDLHVAFGLSHPAFYTLMFGNPQPGHEPPAALDARRMLLAMLQRAAQSGVLTVPVEVAARMTHAACVGVTLSLIAEPDRADATDISRQVRDAVFAAVFTEQSARIADRALASQAIAMDAALDPTPPGVPLTQPEIALLRQWLSRLAA